MSGDEMRDHHGPAQVRRKQRQTLAPVSVESTGSLGAYDRHGHVAGARLLEVHKHGFGYALGFLELIVEARRTILGLGNELSKGDHLAHVAKGNRRHQRVHVHEPFGVHPQVFGIIVVIVE